MARVAPEKHPHRCLPCTHQGAQHSRCGMGGRKPVDLYGKRFGRITAIEISVRGSYGKSVKWRCVCDFGNETNVSSNSLVRGQTLSCGCLAREKSSERAKIHEFSKTSTYTSWTAMHTRCSNKLSDNFSAYGGRGIKVCDGWSTFAGFLADMGERPKGTTLDRIDPNGNYEPSNCRWANKTTQDRNKRNTLYISHNGVTKSLQAWAEIIGIHPRTLRSRVFIQGWPIEKAISEPINTKCHRKHS